MSKAWLLIVLVWALFSVGAQAEAVSEQAVGNVDGQRQRIESVRKEKLAELSAQDAACSNRFAVTDCQNKVGVRRREMLADLKRQETRLNEVDRRKKGAEQLQRSQDKATERAQRESEVQITHEGATLEERQKNLDEKVPNHQNMGKSAPPAAPVKKIASGLDAPSMAINREAFVEKQRAAEQRRLDREKRLLDKPSGSAPLPQAP